MTLLAERLKERYFRQDHPYRIFEREVEGHLRPEHTLLDAGCGRTAPVLVKYRNRASRLIGIDVVDFAPGTDGLELHQCDLGAMPLEDDSVDVIMSRSVMEHVAEPARTYQAIRRVLKPGGHFVFLTPNLWDYASIIAMLVPNRFHPWIVARTEGRDERDVFPVVYRTNTRGAINRWARQTDFAIVSFRYLGQYPSYFLFNGPLFLLATAYEKAISRVPVLNVLQGWILVVMRKL